MKFIMERPGVTLILVGIAAYFLRPVLDGLPLVGGIVGSILFIASIFFVIGGVWIMFMGRSGDDT